MIKHWRSLLAILLFTLVLPLTSNAQSTISGSGLAGIQSSNLPGGAGTGTYLALRGNLGSYFAEYRMAHFGSSASSTGASLDETGYLAGYRLSLFNLEISGAAGLGNTTYKPQSTTGFAASTQSYQSLAYEAQAIYHIPIVPNFINAGIGVNAVGETSSQQPVFGVGGVASLSIGF